MPQRTFYVEIWQGPSLFGQKWRWRAVANGNHERLASGESYRNKIDMLDTVWDLLGDDVLIKERARGLVMVSRGRKGGQ